MPCQTIVRHTPGKRELCGEPATTYTVTKSTYSALNVTVDFCYKHAIKAQRKGFVIRKLALESAYVARTNGSTHCQS